MGGLAQRSPLLVRGCFCERLEAPHSGQILPAGLGLGIRQMGSGQGLGFKGRRQLRVWMAGNHQWLLVVGTWSEARVVESLKPEQLASARACIVAVVSPQVGLGAPRRQAQGPFGCSCSCLGCETSGREKSTPTWLPPTKSPIHVPLHPPSPPLISDPVVYTRRGG